MPAPLIADQEAKEQLIQAVFKGLEDGSPCAPLLRALGVARRTWDDWMASNPQWSASFARAQEAWATQLVEAVPAIARDRTLGAPEERKLIIDANLKTAALLCPRRFSQSAVDRLAVPDEFDTQRTVEEVAARLVRAAQIRQRMLPPAIEGECVEV